MPFWLLYRVSDLLYFFVYVLFRYRKKVVLENLRNSFPKKSEEEINTICKKFYTFFCDWTVEMIKSITISKDAAIKRCHFTDTTLLKKLHKENRKVIFVLGHFGNFELAGAEVAFNTKYQLQVIYRPLKNKYFNQLINKKRVRFGTKILPMKATFKTMVGSKNSKELSATVFIADQTPPKDNAYWTTFLNQETPIFWGTEIIASKLNYPVIFVSLSQPKRGYYEMTPELICKNPQTTQKGEISEWHTNRLEKMIKRQPELWLWSHKRWKHKKPISNG